VAENARYQDGSHPPLEPPFCPRNMHEGFWYGFDPTGYKVMRRASHSVSLGGSALDQTILMFKP
jgi:hypothetical protein